MTPDAVALLAPYLRPDLAADAVSARLAVPAERAAAGIDPDAIAELARAGEIEKLAALLARALLTQEVRARATPLPVDAARWISTNVTAHARNAARVRAIWRVEAGLGEAGDAELRDHAIRSALAGKTETPVPGTAPTNLPAPGKGGSKMTTWTELRDRILASVAINPAGLPEKLRKSKGQEVYVDAVVQGVATQQHFTEADCDAAFLWATSALGLMLIDGHYNPTDQRFYTHLQKALVELGGDADESGTVEIDTQGLDMFAPDPADESQRVMLFKKVMQILGVPGPDAGSSSGNTAIVAQRAIFVQGVGHVGRKMANRYDDHRGDTRVMTEMVISAYTNYISDLADGAGSGGGGGIANVDLPPLHDPQGFNDEIEPDNVRAVSTIYVTYQLEFAIKAAYRVLDLFVAGLLPIPASDGSARDLDNLYWEQDDLLDEASRYSVYARVLGAAGGQIAFDIQPNTEFNKLLLRAVSAVSEFEREQSALTHFDNAALGRRFQSTKGEFVRKAIRDFAANVSLRGWAGTAFTAERMARQIKRVLKVLSLPAVKNAFGVTTPWQVVERISQREFGITVNTVLHRTLAVETQTIMRIIADHHTVWSLNAGNPLFPEPGQTGSDLDAETTRRLMVACQHFRAVTGVGDTMLDEYSTPVETEPMPSLPDMSGFGGSGAAPGIDMAGLSQLRDMVSGGQTPSIEQLRAMLPGF